MTETKIFVPIDWNTFAFTMNGGINDDDDIFVLNKHGKKCPHSLPKHPNPANTEEILVYRGRTIFVLGGYSTNSLVNPGSTFDLNL